VVAVTGYPGYAAAGLEILTNGTTLPEEIARIMRSHFLWPVAHMNEAQALVKNGIKACIDISDGLISDLGHICHASGVSAKIDVDSLPVDWRLIRHAGEEHARELTLTGGESYELLFTGTRENVEAAAREIMIPVTIIGEIIEARTDTVMLQDKNGEPVDTALRGWQHF
jgi:thiamine-monophosphate kinase